jgi:hypothetical protein
MYGLRPVPFKDGTLLFLELSSSEFGVISVHQRGMEITVNGVCGEFGLGFAHLFGPGTPPRQAGAGGRTWDGAVQISESIGFAVQVIH